MTRYLTVERALRTAAPHALLDVLRAELAEHYAAQHVDLLMADYSLSVLQRVTALPLTARPLPVHNSPQGRAFGSQRPHREALPGGLVDLHLPVTVRGDRLGILSVRLTPEDVRASSIGELAVLADILGREILVAERDTDLYLQARRAARLTLAAEMQWQLLPGRSCARDEYAIGAQLEPAYSIRGDNFDWSSTADSLTLTVTNGLGEGIEAALLTSLAVNALRNARRAGLDIADQAALADQALYARHRGDQYVSTLLLTIDHASGLAEIVDAGSPHLWRRRGRATERIELDAQLPLGMFEESRYTVQRFQAEPGDRLVIISDGVHAALSPTGERYGEHALARAIHATSLLSAADVPGAILRELPVYRDAEADDDALVVCLDWYGQTTP